MRPQSHLRAVCALSLAGALTAAVAPAVAAPAAATVADPGAPIQIAIQDHTLGYDDVVGVTGRLASGQAAAAVRLELRAAGSPDWTPLRSAQTAADGRFALRAHVRRSGALRVVQVTAAAAAVGSTPAPAVASAQSTLRVGAHITRGSAHREVSAGHVARFSGAVMPARAGRTVALQLRTRGRWRTVDRDRTNPRGGYRLHERLRAASSIPARVRFGGDGLNAAAHRSVGRVDVYRPAFASWYGPGLYGNHLGCGGTLTAGTIGVANKTLPCGTKLTLRYHGRTVRASVVDRGPYVGGREFDLTAATKARLRFGSTGYVQVTA
jgi:rare lipoprotein A